jgi:hypothetical protein
MHLSLRIASIIALASTLAFAQERSGPPQPWSSFKVHDMSRPAPPVVTPATEVGKPPSDAVVLFDGTNLDKWEAAGGGEPTFKLQDGAMLSYGPKNCQTKQEFGDVQLHIEWAEPTPPKGDSQGRGNSGVFLMGKFETQVLDSFDNKTYADGSCGAVYGQYPPMANACRPPGEWQSYDIVFTRPRYEDGKLKEPAYITTIHNGVVLQNHQRIEGPTGHMIVAKYPDEPIERGPVALQFHGNPVRYRNIWVRDLEKLEVQQQTGKVAEQK